MNVCAQLRKIEEHIFLGDDKIPDMIEEKLYIGNMINAAEKEILKGLGITHILIFASYIEPIFPNDFVYKQIEVHDLPTFNIRYYFEESQSFINEGMKEGAVLIHCAAGFSRSTSCAIAYLMKQYSWTYEESFNFVKARRRSKYTNPNFGFKQQLKDYEKELSILRDMKNILEI